MRKLLFVLALFLPSIAGAQVFRQPGWCQYGGQAAIVQGLASSNDLMGSYPGCMVDVFISGSGTHATIYSDSGMTPLGNPFTADVITGKFGFYAAAGCYDVVISGAGIPSPDTTPAVCLATSVTAGTVTSVTQTNNASSLISVNIANPTTTPAFTFGLTQFGAHTFWGNGTGSTATPSATVIGVGDLPFTYSGNTTKLVTGGTISGTGVILCTDASGNATTSGCPSASGITGSGTINHLMGWASSSTAGNTNFTFSGNTLTSTTGSTFNLTTPAVSSGFANSLSLLPGGSTDAGNLAGGGINLITANESTANQSGSINITTGTVSSTSGISAGEISLTGGDATGASGGNRGGNIHLNAGGATSGQGGLIFCGDANGGTQPGCNLVMGSPGNAGTVAFMGGHGVPSGTCQVPLIRPQQSGFPILYLRDDPVSASTTLYVCTPPNTWTAYTAGGGTISGLTSNKISKAINSTLIGDSSITDNGTTVSTGEQIVSTLVTGTPPLVVASTTNVVNLNASSLNGATFAAPGTIGGGTPAAGTFTTLTANTSVTINGGTPILKVLSATATLDFGSLVSIGCEDLTLAVTGAAVGDTVALGVPNASVPSATFTYTAWVSAADTVTIRGCALVSGDPASGTFRATVMKF